MTIPVYPWFDLIPEDVKDYYRTRNQLAEEGLRPGGDVVARVVWERGRKCANLYDKREAKPKKVMTPAQQAALDKARIARSTCPTCHAVFAFVLPRHFDCPRCFGMQVEADQRKASRWAATQLADRRAVILDSETTGLDGYLVQVALLQIDGTVLLDTLVNPQMPIPADATSIHGITDTMVKDAPTFDEIEPTLRGWLFGRRVLIYNQSFDEAILWNELIRHIPCGAGWRYYPVTDAIKDGWIGQFYGHDVMVPYSAWCGEWSKWHENYRWQPLPGGDHTALGDCRATLDVLKRMAEGANV